MKRYVNPNVNPNVNPFRDSHFVSQSMYNFITKCYKIVQGLHSFHNPCTMLSHFVIKLYKECETKCESKNVSTFGCTLRCTILVHIDHSLWTLTYWPLFFFEGSPHISLQTESPPSSNGQIMPQTVLALWGSYLFSIRGH